MQDAEDEASTSNTNFPWQQQQPTKVQSPKSGERLFADDGTHADQVSLLLPLFSFSNYFVFLHIYLWLFSLHYLIPTLGRVNLFL
jgi:hypothetical protein